MAVFPVESENSGTHDSGCKNISDDFVGELKVLDYASLKMNASTSAK
jgi:hypothetical protein